MIERSQHTKIVLFNCLNNCDLNSLIQEISKYCITLKENSFPAIQNNSNIFKYPYYIAEFNKAKYSQLKSGDRLLFVACPRNSETFLDFAKVADLLVNVSGVEFADLKQINVNPAEFINAIDDQGEKTINLLRAQGTLRTINAVVGWNKIPLKNHKDVKFYFKRLFEETYPSSKTHFLQSPNDIIRFLMDVQNSSDSVIEWRKERGYFLADSVELITDNNQKKVLLSGFLKNGLSTEELVHVTGVGDFKVDRILGRVMLKNGETFSSMKECFSSHPLEIYSEGNNLVTEQTKNMMEEQTTDINELSDLNKDLNMLNIIEEPDNDMPIDESDDESFDEETANMELPKSEKFNKRVKARTDEEKQFEDEVEYDTGISLKQRYKRYRHLGSFAKDEWNKFVG